MAIPKIIHYCWLSGDEMPFAVLQNIESWKKILPDYELVLWNREKTIDIKNTWFLSAIEQKKWAFAADYVRLYALYNFGGIYLDCDVEVLKSFDDLLEREYFLGRETARNVIEAAVMGATPGTSWVKNCLEVYKNAVFDVSKIESSNVAIPYILKHNLSTSVEIFPSEYFSPKNNLTGKIKLTEKSYCIHHFDGAWFTSYQRKYFTIRNEYSKKFGPIVGFLTACLFALQHKLLLIWGRKKGC